MALNITRRVNEVLLIGDNIRITVFEIRGPQVTLNIEAPRKMGVMVDNRVVLGALKITRQVNEDFFIGDNIRISIGEIRGFQVSLDIEAPREITIHRQEIADRIASGVPYRPYEDQ
jgi:carbon storage regulator